MTWIQTVSGKAIDLIDPDPAMISIEDIAWSLSRQARYNGHTRSFVPYSVAEHCVHVSRSVSPENALSGLMHDASEAFIGDLVAPLKGLIPQFKMFEKNFERVIGQVFSIPGEIPQEVKDIDLRMLVNEKKALMVEGDRAWDSIEGLEAVPGIEIECWLPRTAFEKFLAEFHQLSMMPVDIVNWGLGK